MRQPIGLEEQRKHPRYDVKLRVEYWETWDSSHGGLVRNVSEKGALIYSGEDMSIGNNLRIKVFFREDDEFDSFQATSKIVWRAPHVETGWSGYRYGLEFMHMSAEDILKLMRFLDHSPRQTDLPAEEPIQSVPLCSSESPVGSYPESRTAGGER
jgi:hypothetical protein